MPSEHLTKADPLELVSSRLPRRLAETVEAAREVTNPGVTNGTRTGGEKIRDDTNPVAMTARIAGTMAAPAGTVVTAATATVAPAPATGKATSAVTAVMVAMTGMAGTDAMHGMHGMRGMRAMVEERRDTAVTGAVRAETSGDMRTAIEAAITMTVKDAMERAVMIEMVVGVAMAAIVMAATVIAMAVMVGTVTTMAVMVGMVIATAAMVGTDTAMAVMIGTVIATAVMVAMGIGMAVMVAMVTATAVMVATGIAMAVMAAMPMRINLLVDIPTETIEMIEDVPQRMQAEGRTPEKGLEDEAETKAPEAIVLGVEATEVPGMPGMPGSGETLLLIGATIEAHLVINAEVIDRGPESERHFEFA